MRNNILIIYISTAIHTLNKISKNSSNEQRKRVDRINYVCAYRELSTTKHRKFIELVYANKYNLAYINIPKIGSTFLKQVFYLLKFGTEDADEVFTRVRSAVHGLNAQLFTHAKINDLENMITLITVRNPFTRLFSVYIDKIYLPLVLIMGKNINYENTLAKLINNTNWSKQNEIDVQQDINRLRKQLACTIDISFQNFLDYVLATSITDKVIFDHYGPCSQLMSDSLCNLSQVVLLKQETFSDDVYYLLKLINVEDDITNIVEKYMHTLRAESTISSVVYTVYRIIKSQGDLDDCWTLSKVVERMWKAFQIQGYISDNSEFPKTNVSDEQAENEKYVVNMMLDEVRQRPLSEEQRRVQRRMATVNAYKSIDQFSIRRIQDIYALDFELFGYDTDPYRI